MTLAVLTTLALIHKLGSELAVQGIGYVIVGLLVGGSAGAYMAKRVEMTKMPELVAFMHSMIGLAAVFIAIAAVVEPAVPGHVATFGQAIPSGNRLELFLGAAIGAITFSGSVIAFGKLSGKYKFRLFQGAPVRFAGQHPLNLVIGLAILALGLVFTFSGNLGAFAVLVALAFIIGVLIIIPIGGADMPVVVSMLNSYSGWAAAGIGFSLNNSMLIIAGLAGGIERRHPLLHHVQGDEPLLLQRLLGGFGGATEAAASNGSGEQRPVKAGSADDAAFLLGNADSVIIVPGYGLAVARAQHALKELTEKLVHNGVTVKYAIHPVAGRMPGHMNVLLAEAEVPYDQVFEMDDINSEFGQADVVLVLGANDVVNPAAKNDPTSPTPACPSSKPSRPRRSSSTRDPWPAATRVWTTNSSTWTRP